MDLSEAFREYGEPKSEAEKLLFKLIEGTVNRAYRDGYRDGLRDRKKAQ